MAYTLPWSVNKLVSTNINDANSITGTYGSVSLKVNGNTELVGDTIIDNKLAIGKNISSSYTLDVLGSINASVGLFGSSSSITPTTTAITINNFGFSTPAQSSDNFTTIVSPYTAITNWTLSLVSGTAPSVYIGRGVTMMVNQYEYMFPEYPLFNQYLSIENGGQASVFSVSQSITIATAGYYILTMYVWGEYNRYSTTQKISVTLGNGSITNFSTIEQGWSKFAMKFRITTGGVKTLNILITSDTIDSGISISGIQIVSQSGLTVSDGSNTNNQLITPYGNYTNGTLYNKGTIYNYGALRNFGPLNLYLPYSSGSVVVGSSLYGSANSSDQGKYNVLIGQSNIAGSTQQQASYVDGCVAIGYAALEQGGPSTGISRCVAVGYQANRWNQLNCDDNCALGYLAGQGLGYAGSNSARNCSYGTYVLAYGYGSSNDNAVYGYNSISAYSNSLGRSFNSCIGSSSLMNCFSNYNSCIGYGSASNILNTGSNYNTFIGSQVCITQSGSSNVLTNCTFLGATSNVSTAGTYTDSTAVGYGSIITGSNQIILGRATETTYTMGGLNIPSGKILTLLGNISANSLTITPVQLSFLSNLTIQVGSVFTLLGNISANSLTITPVQLSFLSNVSGGLIPSTVITNSSFVALTGAQTIAGVKTFSNAPVMSGASITSATIPNGALVNGANYITTTLTQTISAVNSAGTTVTITPAQFAFLNRVLVSPSVNAGLIPQNAIANVSDFLKATVAATVSAVWSFTTDLTIGGTTTVTGAMSFSTNPSFNANAIDSSVIDNTTTPRFLETGSTIAQNIDAVYTFITDPVFNNDAIPAVKIDNTTTPRFVDISSTQTISGQKTHTGGLITNTLTLSNKSQLESVVVLASSGVGYNWAFGSANTIVITGSTAQTVRFPNPTTAGLGTIVNIVIQDTSVLTARCIVGSGFNVIDSENASVLTIVYPSTIRYVSFMCVSTGTAAWKYVGGQLPNAGVVPLNSGTNVFTGALNTFQSDVTLGTSTANYVNLYANLYEPATATTVSPLAVSYLAGTTSNIQGQLNPLITKTTGISYTSPNTTISDSLLVNTIDQISGSVLTLGDTTTNLYVGGTSTNVRVKGELYVKNDAQKINGYSTLSGTPNVLTKPLSEYYTLSTTSNGSLQLPVIDATMYGSQITFTKVSALAIWTINRGGTDTFRLYKSNSTATATSILLEYNETVIRLVATQGGIWDVIQTDIFYEAAKDWVCGTQYFPMLMNPTNITGAVNWNTSLPTAFHGIQGFSITATVSITLPLSTNVNVPDGLHIKFRRVGGTLATSLQCIASTGDTIMAYNALATTAAGTAVIVVLTSTYWGELYLNKTTKVWYCM